MFDRKDWVEFTSENAEMLLAENEEIKHIFFSNFLHSYILREKKMKFYLKNAKTLSLDNTQLSLKHFHKTELYPSGNNLTLALVEPSRASTSDAGDKFQFWM